MVPWPIEVASLMPLFDVECDKCGLVWEVIKKYETFAPECPKCGSNFTRTLMPLMKHRPARSVDDMLHNRPPDSKPTKSFAHDRRRGGKDTS